MNLPELLWRSGRHGASALVLAILAACVLPRSVAAQDADVKYYHYDATGNVAAITDGDGAVVWSAWLRPFGQGSASPESEEERPLRFAGQQLEPELSGEGGLYHLGARTFDPFTGRFLSVDPLPLDQVGRADPQRFNRYAYALNNPYRYTDASGRIPVPQSLAEARRALEVFANTVFKNDDYFAQLARSLASREATHPVTRGASVIEWIMDTARTGAQVQRLGANPAGTLRELLLKAEEAGAASLAETVVIRPGGLGNWVRGAVRGRGGALFTVLVASAFALPALAEGHNEEAALTIYEGLGFDVVRDLMPIGDILLTSVFGDPKENIRRVFGSDSDANAAGSEPGEGLAKFSD